MKPVIRVNGRWRCIRFNLYDFLLSNAAKRCIGAPLFVDALCINQRDTAEKEAQVALMGHIYKGAAQVVMWAPPAPRSLSPYSLGDEVQASMLSEAIAEVQRDSSDSSRSMSKGHVRRVRITLVWRALVSSPVWIRLWIVQEAVLAERLIVQVGDHEVDLALLAALLGRVYPLHSDAIVSGGIHDAIGEMRNRLYDCLGHEFSIDLRTRPFLISAWRRKARITGSLEQQPLHRVIAAFDNCECTKRHDRVFGMVGMAESHIRPDYGISLTTLYLHVRIEGIRAIDAEAVGLTEQRIFLDLLSFQKGRIRVFDFTPAG